MIGVGRGICPLDVVVVVEGEGTVSGLNVGRPLHCNQWGLCCVVVRERRTLSMLLWEALLLSDIPYIDKPGGCGGGMC